MPHMPEEWGQTMPQMTPAPCHNAQVRHSIPETTPEMTPDIQRPQAPLRRASNWWRNRRERKTGGCGPYEERQNWRFKGSEEKPDVSSQ